MQTVTVPVAAAAAAAAKMSVPAAVRPAEPEEVDAISEADLFLNFGRDAQAEDVLKEALSKNPKNIPVQLKLLTIYANRKNVNAFTTIARQLKESGNASAWEQAAALGRVVDASNPMYGSSGAAGESAVEAAPAPTKTGSMPALDMDIGFNIPMDLDVTSAAHPVNAGEHAMDFDVSGHNAASMDMDVTSSLPAKTESLLPDFDVTGSQNMDFDVTGSQPNVTATHHMDFDVTGSQPNVTATHHMDFDVTGSHPNVTATQHMDFDVTGSHPNVTATQHMDFDVTGSHPNVIEAQRMDFDVTGSHPNVIETQHMDFDVTGSHPNVTDTLRMDFDVTSSHPIVTESPLMDFDLNVSQPGVAAGAPPEDNMSTVVLSAPMDFDISSAPPAASPAPGGDVSSLGGMDFDISSTSSVIIPAATGSSSSLGGMDFDISSSPEAASPSTGGASSGTVGMDFDISSSPASKTASAEPVMDLGLSGISLDLGQADTVVFPVAEAKKDERWQEVANKLDLARAFQEMGDADTARELLGEVLNEGDAQQIEAARTLIQQI